MAKVYVTGGLQAGDRIGSVKASLFGILAGFRYSVDFGLGKVNILS